MKRWPCLEEITYKGKTDSFFFNHVSCLVMSDTTQPFCGLGKHQQTLKLSKIMCDFESVRNNCHESFEWFLSIPWTTVTKRSTQHGSTCVRRQGEEANMGRSFQVSKNDSVCPAYAGLSFFTFFLKAFWWHTTTGSTTGWSPFLFSNHHMAFTIKSRLSSFFAETFHN